MKLRKITAIAGAAAVLGLGLGACGSSGGSVAPVSPTPATVKAQYLADVALSNALSDTISGNDGWASRPVTAYGNALVKESRTMLRQSWPVSARGDIHVLALAALKVHDDILSRNYSGFETDLTTAGAEANAVRAELGLPAVNTPNIKPARHRPHAAQQQPAPVQPAVPAVPAGLTACGTGSQGEEVFADSSTTSCAFALNVESDYNQSGAWYQTGTSTFYSFSPVTEQSYLMSSSSVGDPIVVTGGNGTLVEFSY